MATKAKWFYTLQEEAESMINEKYEKRGYCNFQEITPNRVFEGWTITRKSDGEILNIIALMVKTVNSVFIYENK